MADTTVSSGNTVTQWEDRAFIEYVRTNRFNAYMSTSPMAVIHANENLTRNNGNKVSIPLLTRLTGSGVSGNTALEGNEEALGNYNHDIDTTTYRNAVLVTDEEDNKTQLDLLREARPIVMTWAQEDLRDKIITALGSIDGVTYSDATEAQKDAWMENNTDRVLFGAAIANRQGTDHSSSLAEIDATNDKLNAAMVSLAKRIAKTADPHIRPFRTNNVDQEWFVMFCNSLAFRDLKTDSTILSANREAWQRFGGGMGSRNANPIFMDGDIIYDGVICREVPEIGTIGAVGTSSAVVGANYLCGAQSVGVGWSERFRAVFDTRDYGFRKGVGVQFNYGVEKLFYNSKQHGVVTVYASAAADA